MPSRPIAALIILFWAGTVGWFGYREIWPVLFPSDSPPFSIELADEVTSEVGSQIRGPDVLWGIYRNDKRIGRAETRLRYFRDDNTFEMETRLVEVKLLSYVELPEMKNAYRLTRSGHLRAIRMEGRMQIFGLEGKATFSGEVHDGKLERHGVIDLRPFAGKTEVKLDPIDAPTGSVLNPMHPVPRIMGLRPGRQWRMPILNPLGDAIEPALRAVMESQGMKAPQIKLPSGPKFVDAEVLNETAMIKIDDKEYECRIIEYRGDDRPARTYVRISDGAVMRQEAYALGEQITLRRE